MHQFFTKGRQYIIWSALFKEYKYLLYAKKIQILNSQWCNFLFQVCVQKSWNVSMLFSHNFLFPLRPMIITQFSTYNVNWKWPENGCLPERRCNKPLRWVFFTSTPSFGRDVHRVICYQWARFSKVPKLFGRISGDNSLCIFNLKASWDTKLFSYFNFYSLYNKREDQLYRISGSEFHDWLLAPEKFSGLSRNGPQNITKVNILKCFTTEPSSARKKLAQVEFALGIFKWHQETLKYMRQPKIELLVPS